jgi:hypothetical protein
MSKHQPALLGGLFIGVLSSVPGVNWLNCCCLWVLAGGALVVYLQQQRTLEPVETADAVIGGLIAGVVGGLITTLATALLFSAGGMMMHEQIREALESNPELPAETRDMILNFFQGRNMLVLGLLFNVPLYAVFGMIGALIGLPIFRKKIPPTAPPAV